MLYKFCANGDTYGVTEASNIAEAIENIMEAIDDNDCINSFEIEISNEKIIINSRPMKESLDISTAPIDNIYFSLNHFYNRHPNAKQIAAGMTTDNYNYIKFLDGGAVYYVVTDLE